MSTNENRDNQKCNDQEQSSRIPYITLLSVVSAFAVIFLHANGCFWTYSTDHYWESANIIECLFYFAVPMFFMITGATLIDYSQRYSLKEYFIRRANKTLFPFLIWSGIGILYHSYYGINLLKDISFENLLKLVFSAKIVSYYWFFPPLFCVYLCIPLLSSVRKEKRTPIFLFLLVAGLAFNNIIPFLKTLLHYTYKFPITVDVTRGYLIYVVLGVLLNENQLSRFARWPIYILGIAGLLIHIIGTRNLSLEAGKIVETYKGYQNIPCILWSTAVFLALKQVAQKIRSKTVWKVINKLAKYTLPFYLMQWFVFDQIKRIFPVNVYSLAYRLGIPLLMIPIIIVITYVIRKIPVLWRIVP